MECQHHRDGQSELFTSLLPVAPGPLDRVVVLEFPRLAEALLEKLLTLGFRGPLDLPLKREPPLNAVAPVLAAPEPSPVGRKTPEAAGPEGTGGPDDKTPEDAVTPEAAPATSAGCFVPGGGSGSASVQI